MSVLAINELKSDWAKHVEAAHAGDARRAYAAHEVLDALVMVGADMKWIDCAREKTPRGLDVQRAKFNQENCEVHNER